MNNKTPPARPLALEMDDASKEINEAIEQIAAKHGLPCYLLEPLVADTLNRLQNGKRIELEKARQAYEAQMAEYERAEKNNE
jgi:hypothetical protein